MQPKKTPNSAKTPHKSGTENSKSATGAPARKRPVIRPAWAVEAATDFIRAVEGLPPAPGPRAPHPLDELIRRSHELRDKQRAQQGLPPWKPTDSDD